MTALSRLVPPYTDRRLALQLAKAVVRDRRVSHRLNRSNIEAWRTFHRRTMTCNICGHAGYVFFEMPDLELRQRHHIGILRETLRCSGCHSKMRDRTVAAGFLDIVAGRCGVEAAAICDLVGRLPADLRVLDTDAHGWLSRYLAGEHGYIRSVFLPGKANGQRLDDERMLNVDLQQMPFSDERFDIVITSEVMEHVRYVERAHREVARCLAKDGVYLFTVPYDEALAETWNLIDSESDEYLEHPPHIHGDVTIRSEGIKSYRVFGRDIFEMLANVGLRAEFRNFERPVNGIFGGDLFTARKMGEHVRAE